MHPRETRDDGQLDLFRSRLDQIIDLSHPLSKLAGLVDCGGAWSAGFLRIILTLVAWSCNSFDDRSAPAEA